ncbi:MAG: GTPase Era [Alphaproteobacteria bacterium]|nr:GTPase Era [Alphaproteobacteria bacterium]
MAKNTSVSKQPPDTYAGFAAILGAPNAGKSTLLNQLVGEKVSIVSEKAQTTRMRVVGVLTEENVQIALIDTPGIFAPKGRLDKAMVKSAWQSLDNADAIVLIADAAAFQPDARTEAIIEALKKRKGRAALVLNKVDKVKRTKLLPMAERLNETGLFEDTFMISALTGDGVPDLKKYLKGKMPKGHWLFPEDQLTDLPERLWASEITREQIFRQLHDELPYAATVVPEAWEEKKDGSVAIRQTIVVMRPNHRAIVLGKNGARIKAIGQAAREEMARWLERKVHLFLDVKADERWQDKPEFYRLFGLEESKR